MCMCAYIGLNITAHKLFITNKNLHICIYISRRHHVIFIYLSVYCAIITFISEVLMDII